MTKQRIAHFLAKPQILLAITLLSFIIATLTEGSLRTVLLYAGLYSGVLFLARRWQNYLQKRFEYKLKQAFQADTAEPCIKVFREFMHLKFLPRRKAMLEATAGMAYLLYSNFDQARNAIDKVDWSQFSPLTQATPLYLKALLSYIEDRDFETGLALAREARRLAAIPTKAPQAKLTLGACATYIEIGEMLKEEPKLALIQSLEEKIQGAPVISQVLLYWALEMAYARLGRTTEAQENRELRQRLAPYCLN